jgi:sodium-coupled neutral amino acid transporter 7/8
VINDLSFVFWPLPEEDQSPGIVTGLGIVTETSFKRRICISTPWFATSLVCAILIPNIGEVIQFLGSLAAVFIFIFPGLCLFQVSVLPACRCLLYLVVSFIVVCLSVSILCLTLRPCTVNISEHPKTARPKSGNI